MGVLSPIVSYQYYEWPGNDILSLQYSPIASYYYQFLDAQTLDVVQTTRTPTPDESIPANANSSASASRLLLYKNGAFITDLSSIDKTKNTIVVTHGWIPTLNGTPLFPVNGPSGWPADMAAQLQASSITANIVAWDWTDQATSPVVNPEQAGDQSPVNGLALGQKMLDTFGPQYAQRIHFIGHSFGTLVNAYAANFLQGTNFASEKFSPTPWSANHMLMTLFDEAEIGTDKNFTWSLEGAKNWGELAYALAINDGKYLNTASAYYHPFPKQFAWAENYVSAFGLLHPEAANVILKYGQPTTAPSFSQLFNEFGAFHAYPISWYKQTVQTDNSAMGFVWPFLWSVDDSAFANRPSAGSLYVQESADQWTLTSKDWDYGVAWVDSRLHDYRNGLTTTFGQVADKFLTANGEVSPQAALDPSAADSVNWIFNLRRSPSSAGNVQSNGKALPNGGNSGSDTNSAYVWLNLVVPPHALSMSFSYSIAGDWQDEALVAAFNGTNVLFLPGDTIQTNAVFKSGAIDVSAYSGHTNEFFVGIVGGTSTNAQLTVENITFALPAAPALQGQVSDGNLILSWPLSAQTFNVQMSSDLANPISWATLTNVAMIFNLQNVVTNQVDNSNHFYRLIGQ